VRVDLAEMPERVLCQSCIEKEALALSTPTTFSDQQRRLMAHVYGSLRGSIRDEVEFDRTPDFAPLDDEAIDAMTQVMYEAMTGMMFAAHAEEAAQIQAEIDAYMLNWWRTVNAADNEGANTDAD